MRLAPFLGLALLLAGCVTPPAQTEPAAAPDADVGVWEKVRALMADVPCEADVGAETSANLLPLGSLLYGEEAGAHGELDVKGDLALAARYQTGGFEVVDLSDPTELAILSVFALDETSALDVKWTIDGDGAIIGDNGAVHLVDLTDPAAPVLASTFDYAENGLDSYQSHMVLPWKFEDGSEYVYVATQTGQAPLYVLKREGWNLTFAGTYALTPVLASDPGLGQHDMTIYHDELLDAPVLYIAEGLLGWSAASLDDPANPQRIGGSLLSLEPTPGYSHTVRVEFAEGKRIVVTMAEVGLNTVKVYDATELQTPILLARWNADPTRPQIPEHNFQLKDGIMYLAHYTEGVYVFNISSIERGPPVAGTLDMQPIAHYKPPTVNDGGALGFANIWDVALVKGVLYANDMTEGLVSIGFGCLTPGDENATATA